MAGPSDHEPSGAHQSKKAAASGWIGSALEYYDFFIYATAASLVFPQIFFPSENPTVAIVASLATYGVGYVARPIGAFVLGHLGRHARPQDGAARMHVHHGLLDHGGRRSCRPTAGRHAALRVARRSPAHPGFRGCRRDLWREFDDPRARSLRPARLFRQLHPPGRAGRADPRRGGFSAARGLYARRGVQCPGAGGFRSSLSFVVIIAGYIIRREVAETPAFAEEGVHGRVPRAPISPSFHGQLAGHAAGRLHGPDERHPGGRHDFRRGLRSPAGLRDRLPQGRVPVDPGRWATSWP